MWRYSLIFVLFFCASFIVNADEREKQINQLLELSGVARQLSEISAFASHQIQQYGAQLDPAAYNQLDSTITHAFDIQRLTSAAKQTYRAQFDAKKISAWIETLSNPSTKRMFALEAQAGRADNYEEVMAYARIQSSMPDSAQRRALIGRLDAATNASELALDSQLAVLRCVLIASNNTLTENKQLNPATLQNTIDQMREEMTQALVAVANATYLYTYREVSDADLEHYVGQYESPIGRWAMNLSHEALKAALTEATRFVERDSAW